MRDIMKNLSSEHRLQALSTTEVVEPFQRIAFEAGVRGFKFQGRKAGSGPILNAVVMHFLSLPEAEREEIIRTQLARLESILGMEEGEGAATPQPLPVEGEFFGGKQEPRTGAKRKKSS